MGRESSMNAPVANTRHQRDVLFIGGGPAGSTVSALLKEKGGHVVLLEKRTPQALSHRRVVVAHESAHSRTPRRARAGRADRYAEVWCALPFVLVYRTRSDLLFRTRAKQELPFRFRSAAVEIRSSVAQKQRQLGRRGTRRHARD